MPDDGASNDATEQSPPQPHTSLGDEEDTTTYAVVVNHEEQYSIWPDYKDVPVGWRRVGKAGPKADCISYIDEVWTDIRPLSLREQMAERVRQEQGNENAEDA